MNQAWSAQRAKPSPRQIGSRGLDVLRAAGAEQPSIACGSVSLREKMGTEIERKFLVEHDAWREHVSKRVPMVQGYFRSEDVAIRVRTQGERAVITLKAREAGSTRGEWEYEIPLADAEELLARFCGDRVVRKVRHYVAVDEHEWEVDVFEGRHAGLVIAELEMSSEDETFVHPPWLGAEVTDDASYYNEALALGG